ncbi:N-acetyltransferase-like protein [Xylariales sp. AK1849]|nr:N-acetyltransferase-like protein [Xylariales sp. AK1849]
MGSVIEFPDAASPDLVLAFPTEDEKRRTWTLNYVEWGGALSMDNYLAREQYLATIPLAENGGMKYWILTDSTAPSESRPVLASCETLRKKVLVTVPGSNDVREDVVYGIGSVYTNPQFRGHRYASRMLKELGQRLGRGFEEKGGNSVKPAASALWSDIGKTFYAKMGWIPCASAHVSLPASKQADTDSTLQEVGEITYKNLELFSKLDESLLRKHMASHAEEGKTRFAFVPNNDILLWHLYRDDFIAKYAIKDQEPSDIKGVFAGPEGRRIWAVWTRNYQGDAIKAEKNTLYILRLVIEDDATSPEELVSSFTAVLRKAQAEARFWNLGKIELWNPTPAVDALLKNTGLEHQWVERENDSIPSLMWYGEADVNQVDWVANEKFCWC